MRLIRKLDEFNTFPSGRQRLGEFHCAYCDSVVVRTVVHGRRDNSCGCQRSKGQFNGRYAHGLCKHPLYFVLMTIKDRCSNPNNSDYHRYGGRGIKLCPEWEAPAAFVAWGQANGWKPGLTVDRKDNDGDYTPDNCCFVSNQINCQHNSNVKINLETARQIKQALRTEGPRAVARRLGISHWIVGDISRGKTWRNA